MAMALFVTNLVLLLIFSFLIIEYCLDFWSIMSTKFWEYIFSNNVWEGDRGHLELFSKNSSKLADELIIPKA